MRSWASLLVGLTTVSGWSADITMEQARAIQVEFQRERQEAAARFAPQRLEAADRAARRGEQALAAQRPAEAAAAFRLARWSLPAIPSSLPPHATPLILPRLRHGDAVLSLAYSPDGRHLASSSKDGTVRVWNLANGREVLAYRRHTEAVRAVAWDPKGRYIVSASGPEIHLWNPKDGQLIRSWKTHTRAINSLAISPDGQQIASGGDDRTVYVWDHDADKPRREFGSKEIEAPVQSLAWSPNGKLLAWVESGGNSAGTLRVYEPDAEAAKRLRFASLVHQSGAFQLAYAPDGRHIATCGERVARLFVAPNVGGITDGSVGMRRYEFAGHTGLVTALTFSPDGKYLATGSADQLVRVWEVGVPDRPWRVFQGHDDQISSLAFSPDGQTLASSSLDQSIRLWSLPQDDSHSRLVGHERPVWSAVIRPDGQQLASAGADRRILLWDVMTGQIQHRLEGHRLPVTCLAYSPDGQFLISGGGDKLIKVWQAQTGAAVKDLAGHQGAVLAIAFHPQGALVVSGSADKTVRIWDLVSGESKVLQGHRSVVSAVAIRPDGKLAATGSADGIIILWDLESRREIGSFTAHSEGVASLSFSPDGAQLISGGTDRVVIVWKFPPGQVAVPALKWAGHAGPVGAVAVSADGRLVASGSGDTTIKIWSLATQQEVRTLRGHSEWVSAVAFAPNGQFLVSASVDQTVRLWDLAPDTMTDPKGHRRGVRALAVSPDGRWFATGGDDHTIRLWDLTTGLEHKTFLGHTQDIQSLAFLPGSRRLVSGGRDQKIRVWDVEKGTELAVMPVNDRIPALWPRPDGSGFLAWQLHVKSDSDSRSLVQAYDADAKPGMGHAEEGRLVSCLAFSEDGAWAVSGDSTGKVRIVQTTNGEKVGNDLPIFSRPLADVAISADKSLLICGSEEGEIKILALASKDVKHTIPAHRQGLLGIIAAPQGNSFVTLGRDGWVRLFDALSGDKLREWDLGMPPRAAAFVPGSKRLVLANADASVYLLDLP